jgi:hypothetical protein
MVELLLSVTLPLFIAPVISRVELLSVIVVEAPLRFPPISRAPAPIEIVPPLTDPVTSSVEPVMFHVPPLI